MAVLSTQEIGSGIDKLIQGALEGKPNSLSPLINKALKAKKDEILENAATAKLTLTPEAVDAEARKALLGDYAQILKKSATNGELTPEQKKEALDSGLGVIGVGNVSAIGILVAAVTNSKSFFAPLLNAAKDYFRNRNGRDFVEILAEKKQEQSFASFAEKNGIDAEKLMAELRNPPQTSLVLAQAAPPPAKTPQELAEEERLRREEARRKGKPVAGSGADVTDGGTFSLIPTGGKVAFGKPANSGKA